MGHRDAFLYILSMVREKLPLTERMIREIHSLVLPVKIMGAAHTPPEPHLVPEQMERLVLDLSEDKRHVIEVAAMFHLNFEGIHPFIDGNGRTGRLILNLMFMQADYPPIDVRFTDRKKYYA
ncbi:MAG: Fic family protein, partial [Clostridia bacterium]|nr:Fic family protein [Clostridia bacterium]